MSGIKGHYFIAHYDFPFHLLTATCLFKTCQSLRQPYKFSIMKQNNLITPNVWAGSHYNHLRSAKMNLRKSSSHSEKARVTLSALCDQSVNRSQPKYKCLLVLRRFISCRWPFFAWQSTESFGDHFQYTVVAHY